MCAGMLTPDKAGSRQPGSGAPRPGRPVRRGEARLRWRTMPRHFSSDSRPGASRPTRRHPIRSVRVTSSGWSIKGSTRSRKRTVCARRACVSNAASSFQRECT